MIVALYIRGVFYSNCCIKDLRDRLYIPPVQPKLEYCFTATGCPDMDSMPGSYVFVYTGHGNYECSDKESQQLFEVANK